MHNVTEIDGTGGLGSLVIANVRRSEQYGRPTARISKGQRNRGGIRIKADGYVEVCGEDLFALREFLAELPESDFVRPADPVDPVEKLPDWIDGDIVAGIVAPIRHQIYVRTLGKWRGVVDPLPDSNLYTDWGVEKSVVVGNTRIVKKLGVFA